MILIEIQRFNSAEFISIWVWAEGSNYKGIRFLPGTGPRQDPEDRLWSVLFCSEAPESVELIKHKADGKGDTSFTAALNAHMH